MIVILSAFGGFLPCFEAYMITTSPIGSPCLRNVFLIERADPGDGRLLRPLSAVALQTLPILVLGFDDDVLHYGQNLRIKLCPFSESEAKLTANSPAKFTDNHRQTHAHIPSHLKPLFGPPGSRLMPICTVRWSQDWLLPNSPGEL